MGMHVELEMLAVLLLLTPLVSDGLVMPKCQVVDQLMSTIPADVPFHDNLVAKLTCHAEVTSNFNTSLIKQVSEPGVPGIRKSRSASNNKKQSKTTKPPTKTITKTTPKPPTKPPATPPKTTQKPNAQTTTVSSVHEPMINQTEPPMRHQSNSSHTDHASNYSHTGDEMPPPPPPNFNPNNMNTDHASNYSNTDHAFNLTHTDHASNYSNTDHASNYTHTDHASNYSNTGDEMPPPPPPNFNPNDKNSRKKRDVGGPWTLYGVFQLPDRFACTSRTKPSFNICNLSCDKLIDDDITDDINCVLAIINSKPDMKKNAVGQGETNRFIQTLNSMLLNTCPSMDSTQYLAPC